ncbi:MAG: thioredoxin domain-containing protein [Lachnospiraceae bacterium]|nr:thioredoxin domain-containing protein [Lachnospiraceae bacterium]
MSNHLKNQNSPYLLQHANNPVHWYPWGDRAFEKARREDKPIFLSIGYSTCHWCHVMAHESFENKEIADILNQYYISVKVDREERPDIDSVYMTVCQALTGNGGWPMSIFMTCEQKPFFAGTYFPPEPRYGVMGFREVLLIVAKKWKEDKTALLESAEAILAQINTGNRGLGGLDEKIGTQLPKTAADIFFKSFDRQYGGFGEAPKFPMPHNLIFLMLYSYINREDILSDMNRNINKDVLSDVVKITLEKMRRGGIFDHIGYGFSRYSTDKYFLVPHFEKMLYDNALFIIAYSLAYKICHNKIFLDTAEQTAEYIFCEMTGGQGEFYSAQDADSEGEEGRFYIWSYEEVCKVLGEKKGREFCENFGITKQGNFEGKNIPNLLNGNKISDSFEKERQILYHYRKNRAKLHLDDKILTSWNSLMICAMAVLYRVTGKERYLSAAEQAYAFIEENLIKQDVIYVSCRNGERSVRGFLDEYAYYTMALIFLYDVTSKTEYLKRAEKFCREAERQFEDENGGYFLYGAENDSLIIRQKETYDGAVPGGNSVMAYCLTRLSQLTEEEVYKKAAEKQLAFMSGEAEHYPAGYAVFLTALLFYQNPPEKITVVMAENDSKEKIVSHLPFYADIKILPDEEGDYRMLNHRTTYYVCRNFTCLPPSNQEPDLF